MPSDAPKPRRWAPDGRWFWDIGMFCLIIAGLDYVLGDVRPPARMASLGLTAWGLGVTVFLVRRIWAARDA